MDQVLETFSRPEPSDVTVAHNLEFDERMLRQSGGEALLTAVRVDTLRCARHIWPELTSHGNQALRYALDVDVMDIPGAIPHRALPDILVTYAIFERMLAYPYTIDDLIEMTKRVPLQVKCGLKKYKGQPWSNVPADYMRWVLSKNDPPFSEEIRATCEHWISARRPQQRML